MDMLVVVLEWKKEREQLGSEESEDRGDSSADRSVGQKRAGGALDSQLASVRKRACAVNLDEDEGLFGMTGGASTKDEVEMTSYRRAQVLLDNYKKHCANLMGTRESAENFLSKYPHDAMHQWWGEMAEKEGFHEIAVVARAVMSLTASSGNLERDFCSLKNIITPKRSSLLGWVVEMLLLCHAFQKMPHRKLKPEDVVVLRKEDVEAAKPPRFVDEEFIRALDELDVLRGDDDDDDPLFRLRVSDAGQLQNWSSLAEVVALWEKENTDTGSKDVCTDTSDLGNA